MTERLTTERLTTERLERDKADDSDRPNYHAPALEKGLDILEFLSAASVPQSQTEIARALGRSSSEIFRMLSRLEGRGYLIRDEHSGRYALSLRLFEMAHTHSSIDQLLRVSREPMREIAESTHESVHLSVQRGDDMLILAQEESPEPIRLSINVGTRQPMLKTASGRLLLAQWDEAKRRAFLANNAVYQQLTKRERQTLQDDLQRARADGFIIAESQFTVGVRDISVIVGNPQHELVAILATPILILLGREPDTAGILSALQRQAAIITKRVGLKHDYRVAVF